MSATWIFYSYYIANMVVLSAPASVGLNEDPESPQYHLGIGQVFLWGH